MNRNQWLLLATCALSLYSVGNIWPVQLSSYRLWKYVGPREFHAYHLAWWHSIWGVILAPAVLVFFGALLMLWWRVPGVPRWAAWAGLALQIALVLGTAALVGAADGTARTAERRARRRALPSAHAHPLVACRDRHGLRGADPLDGRSQRLAGEGLVTRTSFVVAACLALSGMRLRGRRPGSHRRHFRSPPGPEKRSRTCRVFALRVGEGIPGRSEGRASEDVVHDHDRRSDVPLRAGSRRRLRGRLLPRREREQQARHGTLRYPERGDRCVERREGEDGPAEVPGRAIPLSGKRHPTARSRPILNDDVPGRAAAHRVRVEIAIELLGDVSEAGTGLS